jgi:hypothetical protein
MDGTSNDSSASSSEDLTKKFHYEPSVQGVAWDAGCGPVHPAGTNCQTPKIVLTYVKAYADLKTTTSVHVNQGTNTITIKVDTWSTSQIHSMVKTGPEPLDIDAPAGLTPGGTYTVEVVDYHNACIFTGEIKVMLAG